MARADDAQGAGAVELDVSDAADQLESLLGDEDNGGDQDEAGHSAQADGEGDPDPDAADEQVDDEQVDEKPKYTVRIDGEEQQVDLDELVRGYQRNGDYTRKTQALAEQRRQQESEFNAVRAEREKYSELLQTLESRINEVMPAEPNWDKLRIEDPIGFATQWAQWQRVQQERAVIQQEQHRLAQLSAAEQQEALRGRLASESEELVKAIPAWADPVKAKEERAALVTYGLELGFTPEELNSVYDHRAVSLLHKAWKYDQLVQKRQAAQVKLQTAPRVLVPGAASEQPRRTTDVTRAKQRLAQTGRTEDAARLFEKFL